MTRTSHPQDGTSPDQLAATFSSLLLLQGLEQLSLLHCDLSSLTPTLVTEALLTPRHLFLQHQVEEQKTAAGVAGTRGKQNE